MINTQSDSNKNASCADCANTIANIIGGTPFQALIGLPMLACPMHFNHSSCQILAKPGKTRQKWFRFVTVEHTFPPCIVSLSYEYNSHHQPP